MISAKVTDVRRLDTRVVLECRVVGEGSRITFHIEPTNRVLTGAFVCYYQGDNCVYMEASARGATKHSPKLELREEPVIHK